MKHGGSYAVAGVLLLAGLVYLNYSPSGGGLELKVPLPWLQPPMDFVAVNDTHFADGGGAPFYFNGWNSYWLLSCGDRALVSEMLRRGRAMGLVVCRTWAFSDGPGPSTLQFAPGHFNERAFQMLDYVIYEARRNGVRLILSLVNNLDQFGGKGQYVRWAEAAGADVAGLPDPFFSHPTIKGFFKDYIKAILTRQNSYSGIKYSDEAAVFAWELINEPRCASSSSAPLLQAWIAEMAAYIKSLDNKHLVTVGLEGFYGQKRTERLGVNPGKWASSLCSDFIQNSAVEHIDFASVHVYPDNWIPKASFKEKLQYLADWVDSHLNDSEHVLKKPVLFSEVGYHLHSDEKGTSFGRDTMLKLVYDKIYESAQKKQAGAGALIWQLTVEGVRQFDDAFSLVARGHPSTYSLMIRQSCRLQELSRGENGTSWPCSKKMIP